MARRTSRTYQTAAQAQAKVQAAQRELLAEEPMHRYSHPIPQPSPVCSVSGGDQALAWTQVLEQLSCQNQLLVDLLGAVNSLTAALLCRQQQS